jgi:probable FeS assembly SUF system protein SufT
MHSAPREPVRLQRPVRALQVPSGEAAVLEAGQRGILTQALGMSYTVLVDGRLWRIDGVDGDAIGKPKREPRQRRGDPTDQELNDWIWEELREIYDPEMPLSIVELGLVYRCELTPHESGRGMFVHIDMTVTAPGCGMGEQLAEEVADRVLALPRVAEVKVDIVFDPPWMPSMLSEAARLSLGLI